jgi:hypothetical protein
LKITTVFRIPGKEDAIAGAVAESSANEFKIEMGFERATTNIPHSKLLLTTTAETKYKHQHNSISALHAIHSR